MKRRRPKIWVLILLGLGLLLLAVLVWAGLGLYGRLQERAIGAWQDPVLQTRSDEIAPQLALLGLAGWSDQQVVETALSEGEWETAYAALAYDTQVADRERAGLWLSLGQGMAEAGKPERGALCYQQVETIAVLSPVLSDYVRAVGLSQAALGLARLGSSGLADRLAGETLVIVRGSPDLQPVLRQQLVERVAEVYRLLGNEVRRREALALLTPGALLPARGSGARMGALLPTLESPVELPEEVKRAEQERQAAALQAAQAAVPGSASLGTDWRSVLAQALRQEDAVREVQLAALSEGEVRLAVQASLARQQVDWLTVKYRVARGDHGISLVPEWEGQVNDIRSALARAYQDLYSIYEDEVVALPTPEEVKQGWVEVLMEEAKTGRLGLYPNYPEQQIAENLSRWTEEWLRGHPEVFWRVSVVERDGGLDYVLTDR